MNESNLTSPSLDPRAFSYEPARPHVARAQDLNGDLIGLRETLASDPTKTHAQRAVELRRWAVKAQSRGMDALVEGEDTIRRRVRELEATITASLRPGISSVEQAEVRSAFRSLEKGERERVRREAIVARDARTIGTLLGAPGWLSGLEESEGAMVRAEWRRLHFPEELKELERLETDLRRYPHAVAAFAKAFDEIIANPVAAQAEAAAERTRKALSK